MGFRLRTFLICLILCWPLGSFALWWTSADRLFPFEATGFKGFLFYALGGLVFSLIVTLISSNLSPAVRAQNAIETEKEKNGFTDRYIELVEKELDRRVKSGSKLNSPIYMNYIFGLTNAYLVNDNPLAARDVINRVDPEVIKKYTKPSDPTAMTRLMQYFDVQICVCESLKDYDRLENVFLDAKPYMEMVYKKGNPAADMSIREIYIVYNCMRGLYDEAAVYVKECLNSKSRQIQWIGYHFQARVYKYMHQFDNARQSIANGEQLAKSPTEKMYVKLARKEIDKAEAEAMAANGQNLF